MTPGTALGEDKRASAQATQMGPVNLTKVVKCCAKRCVLAKVQPQNTATLKVPDFDVAGRAVPRYRSDEPSQSLALDIWSNFLTSEVGEKLTCNGNGLNSRFCNT